MIKPNTTTQANHDAARTDAGVWGGLLLAVAVSIGALYWGGGPDRKALGLAISPFGWQRLIVIQTLSTLMLSWWTARMLAKRKPALTKPWMTVIWAAVGLAIAGWTVGSGTVVEGIIDSGRSDYVARLLVRVLWCVALQTPWCMLGLAATRKLSTERPSLFSAVNLFVLAMITAVGVPHSFWVVFRNQQTKYAHDALQQKRLVDSQRLVQRLYDVGSTAGLVERTKLVGTREITMEVTPAMALSDLQEACQFVEQRIKEISKSPDPDHLKLAQYYIAMNRPAEAEATLKQVADRDPSAALNLAQLMKEQDRLEASRDWADKVLMLAEQLDSATPGEVELRDAMRMKAYDMLVVLAGEEAAYEQAESYLLKALEQVPAYAALIHGRLAKHYEFTGELASAREHQQMAAELAPDEYSSPDSLLTKMLSSGAPVGLARPKSSRYK